MSPPPADPTWSPRPDPTVALLFLGSGAIALAYEVVWFRRLGLLLGGSSVAAAVTLGAFMAGLALGGVIAPRLAPPGVSARGALLRYAGLEAGAAVLALGFPFALDLVEFATRATPMLRLLGATALLLPPATLLGATWPVLAPRVGARGAAGLYAANTTGAVLGVLVPTFVLLPAVGVRTTEVCAVAAGLVIAGAAAWLARSADPTPVREDPPQTGSLPPLEVLAAGFAAGLAALGLEVVWTRLGAVGLGGSVQTIGIVLATFLAAVAGGAWVGRRWPADPRLGLGGGLIGVAALALVGAATWGLLPYGVAWTYATFGSGALGWASVVLAAASMGGAPAASGIAFSSAVRLLEGRLGRSAGGLYAANTAGSIVGAVAGGLWVLPTLEVRGAVWLFAGVAALAGAVVLRRWWPAALVVVLALLVPRWDAKLYAVGVHLRISDFATPTLSAVRRFADEGWRLRLYDHGPTGAVAVGESLRTGNVWLSVNGKVDASTGDDMPTQVLSGTLPTAVSPHPSRVLVVGLASGVTAGAVLRDPRVEHLDVVELEPAIVDASHFFDHVNGRPLEDARTRLILDDARALLLRDGPVYDVIISEPSNPWISGVSNLFTREYWQAVRARLAPDGVFCQWLQLYGLPRGALRGLVATVVEVFGDVWLFETIDGSDVLLIAAERLPEALPAEPVL